MSKHGYRHVRKVNDGRRKPYFGRFWLAGELFQVGGYETAAEAHQAAVKQGARKTPPGSLSRAARRNTNK